MTTPNNLLRPARKMVTVFVTVALVTLGLTVITSSASVAQRSMASRWTPARYEVRVQHWINKERADRGLGALQRVRCAEGTAKNWSHHLVRADAFYHQDMGNVLRQCGANYAGETLGKGGISPFRLVQLWMQSPPHKAVLTSHYPHGIGIGAVVDSHGQWLTAANFVKL